MKQALIELLTLILALQRLPKSASPEVIQAAKDKIDEHKGVIDTMHGDSELNDPEVVEVIDDLVEVAATSEPDAEYAETPPEEEEAIQDPPSAEDEDEDEEEKPKPKLKKPLIKGRAKKTSKGK